MIWGVSTLRLVVGAVARRRHDVDPLLSFAVREIKEDLPYLPPTTRCLAEIERDHLNGRIILITKYLVLLGLVYKLAVCRQAAVCDLVIFQIHETRSTDPDHGIRHIVSFDTSILGEFVRQQYCRWQLLLRLCFHTAIIHIFYLHA